MLRPLERQSLHEVLDSSNPYFTAEAEEEMGFFLHHMVVQKAAHMVSPVTKCS